MADHSSTITVSDIIANPNPAYQYGFNSSASLSELSFDCSSDIPNFATLYALDINTNLSASCDFIIEQFDCCAYYENLNLTSDFTAGTTTQKALDNITMNSSVTGSTSLLLIAGECVSINAPTSINNGAQLNINMMKCPNDNRN